MILRDVIGEGTMLRIEIKRIQVDEGLEMMDWLVSENRFLVESGSNITEEDVQEKRAEFIKTFFEERARNYRRK